MSSSEHGHGSPGIHEPHETTHPLLWVAGLVAIIGLLYWWFGYWYGRGEHHGGRAGLIELPQQQQAGVDHAKLAADRSPEVLEKGATLYAKNCAQCHGPEGNTNPSNRTPAPRNFHADAFQNGGGPYQIWLTLSNGYKSMPPFPSLAPDERYAVAHFIRETWVKAANAKNYVEKDPIPLPESGGAGDGPVLPPKARPVPAEVQALMAAAADAGATERTLARTWISRAREDAVGPAAQAVSALSRYEGDALLVQLHAAARAGDAGRIRDLLLKPVPGRFFPLFATMSAAEFDRVVAHLSAVAKATAQPAEAGAGKGVH